MERTGKAEGGVPLNFALHIDAKDAVVAEVGVDPFAVGGGGAGGPAVFAVGTFGLLLHLRKGLPEFGAVGAIEAED